MSRPDASASGGLRDVLAARALAQIPRLLSLQDRTPVSPTYGSFDRAWWHYRVMDFPSGMAQKLVLPLALAWSLDMPGNRWLGAPAIRDWVEAAIRFAARAAHKDGSCDDYYPFERAAGAAAFSLLACLDAAEIIGLDGDPEVDDFFHRRARWLAEHEESGRLANHEGLIIACLARMVERFGAEWEEPLCRRAARLLSWQSAEGWFTEYEGADPGYLTLTIAQLADADRRRPDLALREPCRAAIRFLHAVLHPDGSVGGEYASRATANYFPHGFEIAGAWEPLALAVNDRALAPLARDSHPSCSDDRLFGHHLASWMLAWREWRSERPGPAALPEGRTFYPEAKLLIDGRGPSRLYLGASRGGALKLFEGERLRLSDTGPSLHTRAGRVAVTHLEGESRLELGKDRIVIAGAMAWARSARLTPAKSIVLRVMMLTLGRFFPDLVRRMLQRLLVTGRDEAPFRFSRTLVWSDGGWTIRDEIVPERGWEDVDRAGIGGFQSSLTTAMARIWQADQVQPWVDLTPDVAALQRNEPLIVERRP